MADTVVLRGPDDAGYWCDVDQCVGVGHRRLAIVDLTAAGHQPMHSASGRYVIVLNGEIYSHADFRRELEREWSAPATSVPDGNGGRRWRGHSDTETLLAGFDAWGVEKVTVQALWNVGTDFVLVPFAVISYALGDEAGAHEAIAA